MKVRNGGLLILAVALLIGSFLLGSWKGAEFAGADNQAMATVATLQPDYQPWFGSIWEPSPEIASGLFALQAALGAGVLGYYLGFRRGQVHGQRHRSNAGD